MPDPSASLFGQALTEIVRRLERAKQQGLLRAYGLIGGFAVSAWGVPRATHDIDFVLVPARTDPVAIAAAIGGEYRSSAPDDPLEGVFHATLTIEGQPIPIQLILLPHRWVTAVLEHLQVVPVLDCPTPVVSWQALVLLKLYAGGPRDLIDARELFVVHQPDPQTLDGMRIMAKSLGLSREFSAFLKR